MTKRPTVPRVRQGLGAGLSWVREAFGLVLAALLCGTAHADYRAADTAAGDRNWERVLQECKADADAGEKNCQSHLGKLYKTGLGVTRNLPLSVDYLKKCAAQGQMYCEEMLGDSYKNGLGVKTDMAEALRLFKVSAARGNPWAFNNLGNMYRFGLGLARNSEEAARNYRIAADKGNGSAQANLADLYRLGEGVEKNGDTAFQYALKSTRQNYGVGWNILGLLYRDGLGVRQDIDKAIESFKKAVDPSASFPSPTAYANLATIYYQGRGVPVNWDEAMRWGALGLRIEQRDCMVLVGNILVQKKDRTNADGERAFNLAKAAYDLGTPGATSLLGALYKEGIGTAANLPQAVRYFQEGREMGDIGSLVHLGRLHLEGLGLPKDEAKAREYLFLARANIDRLGPGNRKFVESYFSKLESDSKKQAPGEAAKNATTPAPALDEGQAALLLRLEKLQKQLDNLQASANTINGNQVMPSASHMAVRKALVIGNDKYQHVQQLNNAREDAAAIAKSLGQLGFEVSLHQDLDEKAFKQALRDFRGNLAGGEEVLFFFAGHGVQLGSANFLLPTDIKGDNEEQVKDEAVELQRVLDDLKSKNSKFALAIVDACRDNPFKQSGRAIGGRGLAPTTAATGQMVMFSAGAGQQALDKLGNSDKDKNGVFTRVLLKEMIKPGIPVDRVLRNVRNEVLKLSKSVGHEQTPALYDQAVGDFYFLLK